MKFRKKPVVIEAIQWTGENVNEIAFFLRGRTNEKGVVRNGQRIIIPTLEGDHVCNVNDWVIRGIKGEFYPCKPDIFEMTYEKVT